MTEENKYIDLDAMQARADKEFEDMVRENNAKIDARRQREEDEDHKFVQDMMNNLTDSVVSEKTHKRDQEMKIEKAKAIKAIEDKYDKQGVIKSDDAKNRDESYKDMLKGLNLVDGDKSGVKRVFGMTEEEYNRWLNNNGFGEPDTRSELDKSYSNLIKGMEERENSDPLDF